MSKSLLHPSRVPPFRGLKKKNSFFYKKHISRLLFKNPQSRGDLNSFFFSLPSLLFLRQKVLSFLLGFFMGRGFLVKHVNCLALIFSVLLGGVISAPKIPLQAHSLVFYFPPTKLFNLVLPVNEEPTAVSRGETRGFSFGKGLNSLLIQLAQEIAVTYRISFVGLSRRLRKIVKNKYRFRRQYVCVLPNSRLRYGFHLIRFCLRFVAGNTKSQRLLILLRSIFLVEETSPVLFIRLQQQKHVLEVLRRQHFLS